MDLTLSHVRRGRRGREKEERRIRCSSPKERELHGRGDKEGNGVKIWSGERQERGPEGQEN